MVLGACDQPLNRAYDAALFDLDGVLYLGEQAIPEAAEAVAAARGAGMRVAFVTNNASRAPAAVAQRLTALDIPAEPADIVTSAQAAARMAAERLPAGATVLVLGTQALADELTARGLRPVHREQDAGPDGVVGLVQGLAPETSMADLHRAVPLLRAGVLWIAGNTDATLPGPQGPLPGNGAFVDVLARVTGRSPVVAGKPDPALHRESVVRVGARRPLVVGDRLDTDIRGAVVGGADSLLVLTGVCDLAQLWWAAVGCRPTYVSIDLQGLAQPHPQVEVDGETARCRAATVRWVDGAPSWPGALDDDVLRASAALAWAQADRAATA